MSNNWNVDGSLSTAEAGYVGNDNRNSTKQQYLAGNENNRGSSRFSPIHQQEREAVYVHYNDSPLLKKNQRRPLLKLDTLSSKPKNGAFLGQRLAFNSSLDGSPEASPYLHGPTSARSIYSSFSMVNRRRLPQKSSLGIMQETTQAECSDDKYFFQMKSFNETPQNDKKPFTTMAASVKSTERLPNLDSLVSSNMDRFSVTSKYSKKFYSSFKKTASIKEESVFDKPVASTIAVQSHGIREKIQQLVLSLESSGRLTMTMRNLHEFLELIQNLAYLMKASLDTFKLIQTSAVEVPNLMQELSKHPSRESIIKICNWVYLSRCYEHNLKELYETCKIEQFASETSSDKKFDEVQINYLVIFLISYIQDFEKLLTISKQKMTQEVLIREKEVIPRTIRQADVICQCISEMLIEDFRNKKIYLVEESKNLVNGLCCSIEEIRTSYTKIRMNIEQSLEVYKGMYHKIKNYDKNMEGFFERQRMLKSNLEESKDLVRNLQDHLKVTQAVEQNVTMFNDKFTDGIETLKKILSFKLKVENVETLFQMPKIEKILVDHLEALNQYFIRARIPEDERIVAVHKDLEELPPTKNAFSLFVSYFQDLLKSQIYRELFSESFVQLKAIDDSVRELYARVDEQFETFVKSYFSSLIHAAAKHKRAMKNEYWKILTWNDFSNDTSLENSISKVSNSVKIIKNSLSRSVLIRNHNYKNVLEKNDSLDENMRIWTEEVEFADHFLSYLNKIITMLLRPLVEFNHQYEESKPIKARFDGVLLSYIKLKNSHEFEELCSNVSKYIRGKQHDERQDFLRDFEDSLLRYHLETFFKVFFKKLHIEFKKCFTNLLQPVPSIKFEKFKAFIESCTVVLESLCEQNSIIRLPQLCNLFQRRQEDLQMVSFMMNQILLINNKNSKTITLADEANIRSASQSVLFKYLIESIHSYDALHGKLDANLRANELENQMQKLEEEVSKEEFEKDSIEQQLIQLEELVNQTVEEMNEQQLPADGDRSPFKRREMTNIKSNISDIMARAGKLRRKILKMTAQKQLNELDVLQEECKKVIQVSIHNRIDCYDIKVFLPSVIAIREKVEEFKQDQEIFSDEEVIEEILEDLEGNLDTLVLIGSVGEKLELTITGKLEGIEQIQICAQTLSVMKDELEEKLRTLEFLNAEMRNCTQEQCRNIKIMEEYLSNVVQGINEMNLSVFTNEELYDNIRLAIGECFKINFLEHPGFKDKIYSPDLEAIKQEIELIRAGVENLKQLLTVPNLSTEETMIYSYERTSNMEGWLDEEMLQLFRNLVVITRLYAFLKSISEMLVHDVSIGNQPDLADAFEKVQHGKELYMTLQEHAEEFDQQLKEIDLKFILRGKLEFINCLLKLMSIFVEVCKIKKVTLDLKDMNQQFAIVGEKKSIALLKKEQADELAKNLEIYYKDIKKSLKGHLNEDEYITILDVETTFEMLANAIDYDFRNSKRHMMGSVEDEFFFRMNAENIGSKTSIKDSQMFGRVIREVRSILRKKSMFESNIGAKYKVDLIFSMAYMTVRNDLVVILDIMSGDQYIAKSVLVLITRNDVKRVLETTNDEIIDDSLLNFKVSDIQVTT